MAELPPAAIKLQSRLHRQLAMAVSGKRPAAAARAFRVSAGALIAAIGNEYMAKHPDDCIARVPKAYVILSR
jgi:hypothetical protein